MMVQRSMYFFCQSSDLNIIVVLGLTAHVLCGSLKSFWFFNYSGFLLLWMDVSIFKFLCVMFKLKATYAKLSNLLTQGD